MRTGRSSSHKLCTAARRDGGSLSSPMCWGCFSSTAPAISKDLCKCLKGSNLKRELSPLGSAGIRGWVWLAHRPCVDFGDKNKKRKKPASICSLSCSCPWGHTWVVSWSLFASTVRGSRQMWGWTAALPVVPVSILEQCPHLPSAWGSWISPLDPGSPGGR